MHRCRVPDRVRRDALLGNARATTGCALHGKSKALFDVYSAGYRKPSTITALDRDETQVFSRWLNRNCRTGLV